MTWIGDMLPVSGRVAQLVGLMRIRHQALVGCCLLVAVVWPRGVAGQAVIEPDRPDVTNGAHLVPLHSVQFELGVAYTRDSETEHGTGAPIDVRIGVLEWLEAQVGIDAVVTAAGTDAEATGSGVFQFGAKIRLWRGSGGQSLFSVAPAVDVPTTIDEHETKRRDPDVTVTALWGVDVGSRAHLDVNYGVGSIRTTLNEPRFVRHAASGSFVVSLTPRWIPYLEVFSISRERAGGMPVVAVSTGVTCVLRPRLALDAGILFGATADAPAFSAVGGLSFIVRRARPPGASVSRFRRRD